MNVASTLTKLIIHHANKFSDVVKTSFNKIIDRFTGINSDLVIDLGFLLIRNVITAGEKLPKKDSFYVLKLIIEKAEYSKNNIALQGISKCIANG